MSGPLSIEFRCSHCGATFANRWRLRAHLLEHDVVPAGECQRPTEPRPRVVVVPAELSRRGGGDPEASTDPVSSRVRGRRRGAFARRWIAPAAAVVLVVAVTVPLAMAWFTASASVSARLMTGTWGHYLTFAPGCSQATHYTSSGCPQCQPIAALDKQGNLSCDFGDLLVGSTTGWGDVFRVTSSAPGAIKVSFKASGAIAPLLASVGFVSDTTGGALNPKQTRSVALQLVVPVSTAPGTYAGTLTVSVVGSAETHSVPLTVTVIAKKPCPSPSPTATPVVTFAPGCSQATHYTSSGCPQCQPIAALDKQGNLSCDFGDLLVGSTTGWGDVFRVTSSAPGAIKVSFKASGAIAPLLASVGFVSDTTGGALNPKQTRSVALQLVVPVSTAPGTYAGTLTVSVVGSAETHSVPLTVTVIAKKPCPSPSPTYGPLVTLAPGSSTQLSGAGTQTTTKVATVQKDGSITFDFGSLQQGKDVVYADVLDLTSRASGTVVLNVTLSGPVAKLVKHVGYWQGNAGIQTGNLTLKAGQQQQLAFELSAPDKACLGESLGSVTLTVTPRKGASQNSRLSVCVDVVDPPSASPSPSPSVSVTPSIGPSPATSASTGPSASPSAGPSVSASPSGPASASPSTGPVASPSSGPSSPPGSSTQPSPSTSDSPASVPSAPSVVLWLSPLWVAIRLF